MNFSGLGDISSSINIQSRQEQNKYDFCLKFDQDDLLRNSNYFLNSAGHIREFYKLLFKGIESRIKFIMMENEEMKECIKSLIDELMKIIEYKNKTCIKNLQWKPVEIQLDKDRREVNSINNVLNNLNFDYTTNNISNQKFTNNFSKNNNFNKNLNKINNNQDKHQLGYLRNYDILNESNILFKLIETDREEFRIHLNLLIKNFREAFLYDVLKLSPDNEFSFYFSEFRKENLVIDNKTEEINLPLFKEIHEFIKYFKKSNLDCLMKNLEKNISEFNELTKNILYISTTPKYILSSNKSDLNNRDLIFNNQGSILSKSYRNYENNIKRKDETLKISSRDNEFDKKLIINSNKDGQNSDFNSENFNFNNILLKLDDKMHKINSDIKLRIEIIEDKFIQLNSI